MPLCVDTHAEAQALYDAGYDEDIMKPSMFGTLWMAPVWMAPLCRFIAHLLWSVGHFSV